MTKGDKFKKINLPALLLMILAEGGYDFKQLPRFVQVWNLYTAGKKIHPDYLTGKK